jgi:hypothetical protein
MELPNRREPFTLAMLEHYTRSSMAGAHPDSLESSLRDCYPIGITAGCCRSESWA